MNLLESIVTIGNCGAAGFCVANHAYEIAAISGGVGVAMVLVDTFVNYTNRRAEEELQRQKNEWEMTVRRLQYGGV